MCYNNVDGSLTFVGRKDAQVKINGQRVELGDVEHHVRTNLADGTDAQVVAEVVIPRESSNSTLVVFLEVGTWKAAVRPEADPGPCQEDYRWAG